MKEIKFRAWDEKAGMIYDIQNAYDMYPLNDDSENNERYEKSAVYRASSFGDVLKSGCPIMQYTGQKDKNGKEIWEGDVIDVENNEWEIIGNIYENPELRKEKGLIKAPLR